MVGSEISASEVRNQEFKVLKPLSKVRGHHFRPIFSRIVPHVFVPTGIKCRRDKVPGTRLSPALKEKP